MSLRGTKQSHAIQGDFASVRLPRFARNDMIYTYTYFTSIPFPSKISPTLPDDLFVNLSNQ